jgi:hypothetical protein
MSAGDRAVLAHQIREAWGGPANGDGEHHNIPKRGGDFVVPPVRDGGTTDALIKIAVQIADDYYSRQAARTALAIPRTTVEPWDGVPGSEDDLIRRGE